jgi:hypothetical protein
LTASAGVATMPSRTGEAGLAEFGVGGAAGAFARARRTDDPASASA